MKKIILRILFFAVIILLIMPVSIGLKIKNNPVALKINTSTYYAINIMIWKLTKDGYFIYNVTNLGDQTIENATIYLRIKGGAHYHGYADVNTSLFIEYLPCFPGKTWQLYQTEDQIFTRQQYPIFHRPLLGTVTEEENFMGDTQWGIVYIILGFLIEKLQHNPSLL